MHDDQQTFYYLGAALALGLLIGLERDWKSRKEAEGQRVAGVRTYGLIGLLGGSAALLVEETGPLLMGLMFLGLAGALTAVYVVNLGDDEEDVGITSLVAGLLTFVFGALLALVMFLGKALQAWLGEAGVLMLATASGVADVDAITLSLARMSQDDLAVRIATTGIVIAAAVNSLVKGGMATVIGGREVGVRVGVLLLLSAIAGLSVIWLLNW